ncbi:MAG: PAS domain S-box protein, partial [Gammaproteobacteria bacterium]|nr:PAS domain S-box protein [Gammaproteobacteria bacterium]
AENAGQIEGQSDKKIVHPSFLKNFRAALKPCNQGGRAERFETKFKNIDGKPFDVDVKAAGIEYDGRKAIQMVARDISSRKKAELEIFHMNDELEQVIEDQTGQLKSLHREMMSATQKLNVAQMATGALHNVKNVLNSLIVGTSMMSRILAKSKVNKVGKVAQLLLDNQSELGSFLSEGERGRFLPNFLSSLAHNLEKEHEMVLQELQGLTKNLEHIKFSIQLQLSSTRLSEGAEFINLGEIVDDALKVNITAIQRNRVRIYKEQILMPPIPGNKHKALQVLVNLIGNAVHALEETKVADPELRIGMEKPKESQVAISISDNGVGITQRNLDEIFTYGFTTRKTGHGFGLHSCLQLASEMGGTLTAHSDGLGKGATFKLILPVPVS